MVTDRRFMFQHSNVLFSGIIRNYLVLSIFEISIHNLYSKYPAFEILKMTEMVINGGILKDSWQSVADKGTGVSLNILFNGRKVKWRLFWLPVTFTWPDIVRSIRLFHVSPKPDPPYNQLRQWPKSVPPENVY